MFFEMAINIFMFVYSDFGINKPCTGIILTTIDVPSFDPSVGGVEYTDGFSAEE